MKKTDQDGKKRKTTGLKREALEKLRYDFLRRSDKYRKLCEMVGKSNLKEPLKAIVIANMYPENTGYEIRNYVNTTVKIRRPIKIIDTFLKYGNVHREDFAAFWEKIIKAEEGADERLGMKLVEDYIDMLPLYFEYAEEWGHVHGVKDMGAALTAAHQAFLNQTILVISRRDNTQREENIICEQIKKIVHRGTLDTRVREELHHYLWVFNLNTQHKADRKIIDPIYEKHKREAGSKANSRSMKRKFERDIERARGIIENVENDDPCWWSLPVKESDK